MTWTPSATSIEELHGPVGSTYPRPPELGTVSVGITLPSMTLVKQFTFSQRLQPWDYYPTTQSQLDRATMGGPHRSPILQPIRISEDQTSRDGLARQPEFQIAVESQPGTMPKRPAWATRVVQPEGNARHQWNDRAASMTPSAGVGQTQYLGRALLRADRQGGAEPSLSSCLGA
jgi:hypothetical protein